MIRNDTELQATQERVALFETVLAEARKTYSTSNYQAMAEGYLSEIDRMQTEIREYLGRVAEPTEAA
jgi:Na+/phosphate symporter